MTSFNESEVEAAALEWLRGLGWNVAHRPVDESSRVPRVAGARAWQSLGTQ